MVYFGIQFDVWNNFIVKCEKGKRKMENKKKLNGYYNYTVVLTYLGMLCGFTGITFILAEEYRKALICLMIAGIFDMFDGTVAATKSRNDQEKRFGIQIDSLSDLICFGVLPALFIYGVSRKSGLAFLCGSFYVLCALIRLAYFNVCEEERQRTESGSRGWYVGLPVTTVALVLPIFFAILNSFTLSMGRVLPLVSAGMALAFLLPFKVKKPYFIGKAGIIVAGIIEFLILVMGVGMEI